MRDRTTQLRIGPGPRSTSPTFCRVIWRANALWVEAGHEDRMFGQALYQGEPRPEDARHLPGDTYGVEVYEHCYVAFTRGDKTDSNAWSSQQQTFIPRTDLGHVLVTQAWVDILREDLESNDEDA